MGAEEEPELERDLGLRHNTAVQAVQPLLRSGRSLISLQVCSAWLT
jgi:hypothetical protein